MANNVEKFVIDLGFSAKDLKQLKELLKLQEKADKASPKRKNDAAKQARDQLKSAKAIDKLGQSTRKAHEAIAKLKEKELSTEKKITQEVAKRSVKVKDTGQGRDAKARFKAALGVLSGDHRGNDDAAALRQYYKDLENSKKIVTDNRVLNAKFRQSLGILSGNDPSIKESRKAMSDYYRSLEQEINNVNRQAAQEEDKSQRLRNFQDRLQVRGERAGVDQRKINELKALAEQYKGNSAKLESVNIKLSRYIQLQRQATMQTKKANLAMQGLNDSTRHLVRSYVSVFAVLGATQSINNTGQKFEAMQSAMLAATGTAQESAQEIAFLDQMTSRLGLSLLDTSDAYTKFLFASKGKLDQSETRELFEGLSELGTTLGVSKERMKLSMNAITQMMNKGKISSEELRLQLAESLPGAIQIFARSIGKSEAELFKMMENGELLASEVLPKVAKEMKAVAAVGLESKLDTLRVAQGQLFNELEKSGKAIFDSGFSEGLKELFQTLTTSLRVNQRVLKNFGEIFKAVFLGIESVYEVVSPIIMSVVDIIGSLAGSMDSAFGDNTIQNVTKGITAIIIALNPLLRIVTAIAAAFDFLLSFFESDKMNLIERYLGEDIDLTKSGYSKWEAIPNPFTAGKIAFNNLTGNNQPANMNSSKVSTQNNTFNIESTDPARSAEEVKKLLDVYSQSGFNVGGM